MAQQILTYWPSMATGKLVRRGREPITPPSAPSTGSSTYGSGPYGSGPYGTGG